MNIINALTSFSCLGTSPDLTFLLDVNAEIGLSKITGYEFGNDKEDKIELRGLEYHQRVNEGYRKLAKIEPNRFRVIPYIEKKADKMHVSIKTHVNEFIEKYGLESSLLKS